MLIIHNTSTNPYFNLATEEYLIKNKEEDIFMLWRNEASIIVGKHQNTLAEINYDYVRKHQIAVVRRLSGGGTVFHDLGNINFSFIKKGEEGKLVDFRKYTQPILDALHHLGVQAKFEGRNDLTIEGKKFSGNAEHVWKDKVLHHGTLLFSAELAHLTEALKVHPNKFTDKAVKSVRSRVTNIAEHLKQDMSVQEFIRHIFDHIQQLFPEAVSYQLTENDQQEIQHLASTKYTKWNWNFGYSPKYNFKKSFKTTSGLMEINMNVEQGVIRDIHFFGDFFSRKDTEELEKKLIGVEHSEPSIKTQLDGFDLEEYFSGFRQDDLLAHMF
jgi:lipoate-protein ligase A